MTEPTEHNVIRYLAGVLSEEDARQIKQTRESDNHVAALFEEADSAGAALFQVLTDTGYVQSDDDEVEIEQAVIARNVGSPTSPLTISEKFRQTLTRRGVVKVSTVHGVLQAKTSVDEPAVMKSVPWKHRDGRQMRFADASSEFPFGIALFMSWDAETGAIQGHQVVVMSRELALRDGTVYREGVLDLSRLLPESASAMALEICGPIPATGKQLGLFSLDDLAAERERLIAAGLDDGVHRVTQLIESMSHANGDA